MGGDSGLAALFDPRTGRAAWQADTGAAVAAAALVPAPEARSVVTAHSDGTLRLLDLRRSGAAAEVSCVKTPHEVTSVVTDGCAAVAGCAEGGVVVWDLDPARSEAPRVSGGRGIECSGAGTAFCEAVAGGAPGATTAVAVFETGGGDWCLAAGHAGGGLDLCSLGGAAT